jgi:hypothetical protein
MQLLRQSSSERRLKKKLHANNDKNDSMIFVSYPQKHVLGNSGKIYGCDGENIGVMLLRCELSFFSRFFDEFCRICREESTVASIKMGLRSSNQADFTKALNLLNECFKRIYSAKLPYHWAEAAISCLENASSDVLGVYEEAS